MISSSSKALVSVSLEFIDSVTYKTKYNFVICHMIQTRNMKDITNNRIQINHLKYMEHNIPPKSVAKKQQAFNILDKMSVCMMKRQKITLSSERRNLCSVEVRWSILSMLSFSVAFSILILEEE